MARYKVAIKPSASKEIDAVGQKKDRQRIVSRIQSLGKNPRPFSCEKLSGHDDRYRVREGNYRILYSIDDDKLLVDVVKVGHRKDVYR
ncbi:MAG TPA: type II toxin-antitoxin system RelE/ParE family toxin [Candidatus Binatia bacterium]|nr:type II toxin-antitoxin system RelE/ParE family toxin [Candidatus Binatia bacterium]